MPTFTPTPVSSAPQTQYDAEIAQDPNNPTLRLQRGYAYIELGAYTDAIKDFDVAIRLDEISADPFLGRGVARYHAKEWTTALADFDHALVLNPDLADAHAWRGYLLSEWGQFNLGIDALRRAIALDDADPTKHIRLGQVLLYNGRPGQAKAEFSTALSLESHSVEAYVGQAMAEAELGDLDAAQTNLSHAMSTGPFHPAALHARAWFHAWYQRDHLYRRSREPRTICRKRVTWTLWAGSTTCRDTGTRRTPRWRRRSRWPLSKVRSSTERSSTTWNG
jgi:tetratricopeptide (TPR) repeat protein